MLVQPAPGEQAGPKHQASVNAELRRIVPQNLLAGSNPSSRRAAVDWETPHRLEAARTVRPLLGWECKRCGHVEWVNAEGKPTDG